MPTRKQFGKWSPLEFLTTADVLCRCECGTIKKVRRRNLLSGASSNCGCARNDRYPKVLITEGVEVAYIAGALHGDAWCSTLTIGLRAKDEDFVVEFTRCLNHIAGTTFKPKPEGPYFVVRTGNKTGHFSLLKRYRPTGDREHGLWLRGLFDSEGNAQLLARPKTSVNSYGRRIAIYNTELESLKTASLYLARLEIKSYIWPLKKHSPRAKKQLYELKIRASAENFSKFNERVSSTIKRKRFVLEALPLSYSADPAADCRSRQTRGARARSERFMNERLPTVLTRIALLISSGQRPVQRLCASIPYYPGALYRYTHRELVKMAEDMAI